MIPPSDVHPDPTPTPSLEPLDALIASYIEAIEGGRVPDRQALFDAHPDQAEALRAFFVDLDRMDRVAAPLRLAGPMDETTAEGSGTASPTTLRYFGDYELLEEVARGGMGIVYKARQASLNRLVALKMVLAGAFASPRDVQRFRIEAEAAANLDHPNIVPIFEVGDHEGQQYYAMKFVEGTSLAGRPRGTPRQEVVGLLEVVRAVDHAHRRGVLHRDLKPSNILVDPERTRLVTDFGLAKRLSDVNPSLTETGQLLGTPRYMSPEQALGRKDLTVAADVYALGVILYERLTGQTPFLAENVMDLLHQVRETAPPRLSSIAPGLGRDLETIVGKCLEKDPTRRYPSAEALALDLENWQAGRPITARPVGPIARAWRWTRRNPAVAALMATVAASLIAGTLVSIAFALRAEAKAVEAGISATQLEIQIARNSYENNGEMGYNLELGLLTYARAFCLAPNTPKCDDLRWFISANMVLLGQRLHNLLPPPEGGEIALTAEAHTPDGRLYAGLSPDGRIRIWEIDTGRLLTSFIDDRPGLSSLQFSPDGALIAAIRSGKKDNPQAAFIIDSETTLELAPTSLDIHTTDLRLWDVGNRTPSPLIMHPSRSISLLFSYDHKSLFITPKSSTGHEEHSYVLLVQTSDGRKIWQGADRKRSFVGIFDPHGRTLLVGGDSETLAVDTRSGQVRYRVDGLPSPISHSGREFPSIRDGRIRFFDVETGRATRPPIPVVPWMTPESNNMDVKFSFDDRFLSTPAEVFDLALGRKVEACGDRSYWVFAKDGKRVYSSDGRRAVDLGTSKALPRPIAGQFHPALMSQLLKTSSLKGEISIEELWIDRNGRGSNLWDLRTGLSLPTLAFPGLLPNPLSQPGMIIFAARREFQSGQPAISSRDLMIWMPRQVFATDPEVVQLWAEVLTRQRLVEEPRAIPLNEAEWEARRRRLVEVLPARPSNILAQVAHDRYYWLRSEVEEIMTYQMSDKFDRLSPLLDRLIEIEPRWSHFWKRSQLQARHEPDLAAADFATATRLAGAWFQDVEAEILDEETMNRLLTFEGPEAILRDELKLGREAIEVASIQLARLRRSTKRTRQAANQALSHQGQPQATYRIAAEFLRRREGEDAPDLDDLWSMGLASFRLGKFEEALAILGPRESEIIADSMRSTDSMDAYSLFALIHDGLRHHREAREWLDKAAIYLQKNQRDHPLYKGAAIYPEARETILDQGFPADPFAR